jgi:hypothetical protein
LGHIENMNGQIVFRSCIKEIEMNRIEFIELIKNCETYDCLECIESDSMWFNWDIFLKVMEIEDNDIDDWIKLVSHHIGNLREFYVETEGCYHKSIEIAESDLMENLRGYLGMLEEIVIKHQKYLLTQEEIDYTINY